MNSYWGGMSAATGWNSADAAWSLNEISVRKTVNPHPPTPK